MFLQIKVFLISGFEDATLGLLNMFSVQTGEFVEMLHKNNHQVTVSSPTESAASATLQKESPNTNLIKQIARITKSEDEELRIILKAVQQQGNGYDCGMIERRTYNQSVMRGIRKTNTRKIPTQ